MGHMWNAKRVRDLRKGLRLRQEDVAEAVGVERKAVTAWEGGREPRIVQAALLADLFGVSLDSLVHDPEALSTSQGRGGNRQKFLDENAQEAAASPSKEKATASR